MFDGSYINLGVFIGILTVLLIWVILEKTVLGYELKAAGFNRFAAEYGGMKVNRNIVLSMTIAGALAGCGWTHSVLWLCREHSDWYLTHPGL